MSLNNISFILHKPQLSENIGACARGIKNFNFKGEVKNKILFMGSNYFVYNEDKNDYSLSLNALMLKLFELEDSNLFERYFYIRAECQTFKEYDSSIHAKSVDYFHAFTNPIWFNIKNSNPSSFESFIT